MTEACHSDIGASTFDDPREPPSSGDQHNNKNILQETLLEEMENARVDAKETLLALVQFSRGVRLITRHMQIATNTTDAMQEGKSQEDDDSEVNDDPLLQIERLVSGTQLNGTVFATDLLRLWDAAHHVRDYARLVTEESTLATGDIVNAQQTAKRALEKAKKARTLALNLHRQNQELRHQLNQLTVQKKCLVQEVKTLRQQAVATRKMDMERLLQQHVAGAILLHEEQLRAMATAAAQQQQQQRQQRRNLMGKEDGEEKKDEDEDMEVVVQAEDCGGNSEEFLGEVKNDLHSPRRNKGMTTTGVSAPPEKEEQGKDARATGAADKEINAAMITENKSWDASSPTVGIDPPPTPESAYSPIKLFPSLGFFSPPAPSVPCTNDNPVSARSVASSQSSFSVTANVQIPPEQPKENVGSKVFNFLFFPEKIGQQRAQEMQRQQLLEKKHQVEGAQQPPLEKPDRPNPLLAIDDLALDEKEDLSVDATAMTHAATTPGSTCASSSVMRASSESGGKLPRVDAATQDNNNHGAKNHHHTPKKQQSRPHNITTMIPDSVSFSDDTLSVQSNLPSPRFQSSSKQSYHGESFEDTPPQDVKLYKDFKMFQSLAIPGDDEIEEYQRSRDRTTKQ